MQSPTWRNVDLDEGILREVTPDPRRIVLWLPGASEKGQVLWERVGNLPGAPVTAAEGLCATAATSIRARQRQRGLLAKLLARLRGPAGDGAWVLPNGQVTEQQGARQTDLLLVWAEDDNDPLDEAQVRLRWPEGRQVRRLGRNLFLVEGIEVSGGGGGPLPPEGSPLTQAEWLLAAARQAGDRRREASALNDLGAVCTNDGDAARAVGLLQEALALAGPLGDLALEVDVRGNLGLAFLSAGQPRCALQLLDQGLAQARSGSDRYALKTALDRLGTALSSLREPGRALLAHREALELARSLGDRRHEAEILWHLATQHADLGEREEAVARGQAAGDRLVELGHPHAGWFAEHLQMYRTGAAQAMPARAGAARAPAAYAAEVVVGPWGPQSEAATGPGLLRMAFTAAKSMAKFLGSGLTAVPAEVRQERLRACAGCAYHTGMRCRVCGCFTSAKARMPHESCPLGKWPA